MFIKSAVGIHAPSAPSEELTVIGITTKLIHKKEGLVWKSSASEAQIYQLGRLRRKGKLLEEDVSVIFIWVLCDAESLA